MGPGDLVQEVARRPGHQEVAKRPGRQGPGAKLFARGPEVLGGCLEVRGSGEGQGLGSSGA